MAVPVRKLLLVEGEDDKRVIPELIEKGAGLPWGESKETRIVDIKQAGGDMNLLAPDYIATELKVSRLHSLGVILDADEEPVARWQALRDRCLAFHPDFPEEIPADGLFAELKSGIRFGAWLMPDNRQQGMLETFLLTLRPAETSTELWRHTTDAVDQAKLHGAAWQKTHRDKAICHTFLAFQDPPGRQLHQAINERLLDAKSDGGKRFVAWFRRLYDV